MSTTLDRLKARLEREVTKEDKPPTVFVQNGALFVSAEDGRNFADYYGEFRGGYPWIESRLVDWARSIGRYWEWQNPGCLRLSNE